jgi:hypothetical protein
MQTPVVQVNPELVETPAQQVTPVQHPQPYLELFPVELLVTVEAEEVGGPEVRVVRHQVA